MTIPSDLFQSFVDKKKSLQGNKIWPITTFSLSRNLSVMKFLPCLSKEKKLELLQLITSYFNDSMSLDEFFILSLKDSLLWQKELLLEHFVFPYDLIGNPGGEALIVNRTGDILIAINFQDHLILHIIDFDSEPEKALDKLIQLDNYLHNKLSFAFSSEFGFLTTNPKHCGTALKGHCFLHTPALVYSKGLANILNEDAEIVSSALLPSTTDLSGNVIVLSNRCSLGLTEEQIISSLRIWASKISVAESSAKKCYSEESSGELKNHILRSLGLLTHSYHLELKETLDALSWLQLGIELGWIRNPKNHSIGNLLFWQVRRAHLALQQPEESRDLKKETITQLRANLLKMLAADLIPEGF
ncbi:protein arginine kinase [Chlamydia sp. 17-3921]|uniref:protein arginine kinase n=1 Tax=Chlamydia sp. 17-3921 TaxID=2675798 RepID=UPI001919A26D|nr:protein arginine kinase [Chlamydia sp. 17-3921]